MRRGPAIEKGGGLGESIRDSPSLHPSPKQAAIREVIAFSLGATSGVVHGMVCLDPPRPIE